MSICDGLHLRIYGPVQKVSLSEDECVCVCLSELMCALLVDILLVCV